MTTSRTRTRGTKEERSEEESQAVKHEIRVKIGKGSPAVKKGSRRVKQETDGGKPGEETTIEPATQERKKKHTFRDRLEECRKFRKEHGHCKIPTTGRMTSKSMGIWVQEMRRNYRLLNTTGKPRQSFTDEMLQELNDIGFEWNFTPKAGVPQSDILWEKCYEAVRAYREEHGGSFDVPPGYRPSSSSSPSSSLPPSLCLAEWVREQRVQKKRRDSKLKCNISPARIKKLNEIGFNFDGPRKLPSSSGKK